MRRSVVISVALHGAILLWIVVMFPLGRALHESPKDIPLVIMSPAEFTKLKAGMAHAKADKPLKAKAEEPKPKAVTEKKPVEPATPAPKQKPAEKKPEPKLKTVVAPKPKKALVPKQAEATPKKPVKTANDDTPKPKLKPKPKPKKKPDFNSDRILALLNKIPDAKNAPTPQEIVEETPEEPVRGQSTGTDIAMSVNEIDALRARIAQCWNPPPGGLGAESMVVKIRLKLNEDGTLVGYPTVSDHDSSPFFRAAADSAVRAVFQCQPYVLPSEKYSLWRDMILNFDPSRMYGSG